MILTLIGICASAAGWCGRSAGWCGRPAGAAGACASSGNGERVGAVAQPSGAPGKNAAPSSSGKVRGERKVDVTKSGDEEADVVARGDGC